jgi:predicted nucleic acid-binding protein
LEKGLTFFLQRHRRVALDTSTFIYHFQANPRYSRFVQAVFAWLDQPGHIAVTSTVTLTGLLVQPYRRDDWELINLAYATLVRHPNLKWIPADLDVADIAAKIRAKHRLETPDAIQAATAVKSRATGLITNDPIFERIDLYETLVLDRLL